MDEPLLWKCLADVASGMHHLHQNGVIHMDIKPENVLMQSSSSSSPPIFLIADFGQCITSEEVQPEDGRGEGDSRFMAPEVLTSAPSTSSSDVFSLGLICLEVVVGCELPGRGTNWQNLRQGKAAGLFFLQ